LVPAGISIVNISSGSQNIHMKWRFMYDLFFCLIKYSLCLVCKLFWKTEIFIRSRPTLFSKSHIFQMFPWWVFERSHGQRNRRPESCEKSLGIKVYYVSCFDLCLIRRRFYHLKSVHKVFSLRMSELQQRAVIKFIWKERCLANNVHGRLQAVDGHTASALSWAYFWIQKLNCSRENFIN
jgi:hypothetical protein